MGPGNRHSYNPNMDDPSFRARKREAAGIENEEEVVEDEEYDEEEDDDYDEDEDYEENPNKRRKAKKRMSGVGKQITGAVTQGAKLAAANRINDMLSGGITQLAINSGMPKEMIESPFGQFLLKLGAPALLMYAAEKHPNMVPKAELLSEGAALALTGATQEVIEPMMMMIQPMLKQIAGEVSNIKAIDGDKEEAGSEDDNEIEIEVVA